MKSLHNKIVALGLSGLIIGGFISSSSVKVYANFVIDPSSGKPVPLVPIEDKFNPSLYPNKYPELKVDKKYIYRIFYKRDVLVKGNNQGIDRVYKALEGSGFKLIKCSGIEGEIDRFLEGSNIPMLENKSQLAFKSVDSFKEYIRDLEKNPKPEEGVYRFFIGGFEGVFYFNPKKYINMFDQVKIDLVSILRNESKYGYKVLDYSIEGKPLLEKYKEPIKLYGVDQFLRIMGDRENRKRPGIFGGKHGGIHEGGIYCVQIDDLIFLFRALD